HVKTSHHAVGMGLEFQHLATEDQQKLDFLIGTLAGHQEMQPEEKRTVVPADPPPPARTPPPLPTRPTQMASMTPPARRPAPATPPARSGAAAPAPNPNATIAQGIMRAISDLNDLEQNLVKDRIDPRLIAQLHDSVEHVRQTAYTVQQWVELNSSGGDPFE